MSAPAIAWPGGAPGQSAHPGRPGQPGQPAEGMARWPVLRDELDLLPGPPDRHGAPTWSLHDPARHQFFRIDWLSFEILARWSLADPQAIAAAVAADTPLSPTPQDVLAVAEFLRTQQLLRPEGAAGTAALAAARVHGRPSAAGWLLHHYLFFRVPLWRPDAALQRLLPWVAPLYSRGFAWLTLAALVAGLWLVSRQWGVFTATLVDTLSWQGLLAFALTLVAVKGLHELGHAFTARRLGCRVPTMGVAFLVGFPMAYTDVNEAWKLPERRQRLAVGAAGIVTELVIAVWATLAWALLPDGPARGLAFLLATTTWVSTLAINASPFMRFDGYFLLMDWLDLPNLHARAFALARWRLRRLLFAPAAAADPQPEPLAPAWRRGLVAFAWATWVYRLVVFLGIAWLVYRAVPKPLGPVLGAVELAWFIALPMAGELRTWVTLRHALWRSRRTLLTLALLATGLAAVVLPWDTRVSAQGVLRPAESRQVVAPAAAQVQRLDVADGSTVQADQRLLALQSPDLAQQQQAARVRAQGLAWQAEAVGVDARLRDRQGVLAAERSRVQAELDGIARQQARQQLKAPAAGQWFVADPDLRPGAWLKRDERIGTVADLRHWRVVVYLPEAELPRVRVGDVASFHPEGDARQPLPLTVQAIDRDATRVLPELLLAGSRGGGVPVREQHRQFIPEAAVYRVTLAVPPEAHPAVPLVQRGQVVIRGTPKAWADDLLRSATALWLREAGF